MTVGRVARPLLTSVPVARIGVARVRIAGVAGPLVVRRVRVARLIVTAGLVALVPVLRVADVLRLRVAAVPRLGVAAVLAARVVLVAAVLGPGQAAVRLVGPVTARRVLPRRVLAARVTLGVRRAVRGFLVRPVVVGTVPAPLVPAVAGLVRTVPGFVLVVPGFVPAVPGTGVTIVRLGVDGGAVQLARAGCAVAAVRPRQRPGGMRRVRRAWLARGAVPVRLVIAGRHIVGPKCAALARI